MRKKDKIRENKGKGKSKERKERKGEEKKGTREGKRRKKEERGQCHNIIDWGSGMQLCETILSTFMT